ncbi:hypothetical protein ACRALDRAFT_1060367 [Sodiomyces alcalophilus JCM 7366]|uniref:uncharacterized protein n=1 Tax=Sodiomyces alcalophilus JCM 7366 TaxID=591952 RepID=UPI0039B5AF80
MSHTKPSCSVLFLHPTCLETLRGNRSGSIGCVEAVQKIGLNEAGKRPPASPTGFENNGGRLL